MKAPVWKMERRKLKDLRPFEQNPRRIMEKPLADLTKSIAKFGLAEPLVIQPDGLLIGGHARYQVLLAQGVAEADCYVPNRALSQKDMIELNIRLNKNVAGEFDFDALANLDGVDVMDLTEWGFDEKELLGSGEFGEPAAADAEAQMDKAAELNRIWKVKPGDLWHIGEHRLLCGDSTNKEDVERVMGGEVAQMMVTDPPYGVEYDPSWRAEAGVNKNTAKMGKVKNDDIADWTPAWKLFAGDVAYVYHAGKMSAVVQASLECSGFVIRSQIIWAKDRMALSRGDYHWQHEPVWYVVRDGKPAQRNDDRTQTTLWNIPARDDSGHGHGTQKPLECMAKPIRNHFFDLIYDPFLGSGTTMVACENLKRKCRGIEISPDYCAVILQRMADAFPSIKITKA